MCCLRSRHTSDQHPAPHPTLPCLQASALALRKVPEVNASWFPDFIRQYHTVDCSVAVQVGGQGQGYHTALPGWAQGHVSVGQVQKLVAGMRCTRSAVTARHTSTATCLHITSSRSHLPPADAAGPDGAHCAGRRPEGPGRHRGRGQGAGGAGENPVGLLLETFCRRWHQLLRCAVGPLQQCAPLFLECLARAAHSRVVRLGRCLVGLPIIWVLPGRSSAGKAAA